VKHYILDGHNIMHKEPEWRSILSSNPVQALNKLILVCQRITAGKNKKCTIYFDGSPPGDIIKGGKNIQVTFSYDRDADALIKSLIARSKNPRNLVIISDDSEIQRTARAYSCGIQSVQKFLTEITSNRDTDESDKPPVNDISIEEWLRLFNKKK